LRTPRDRGELHFAGTRATLADHPVFQALLDKLHEKQWVVYAKRRFAGAQQVSATLPLDLIAPLVARIPLDRWVEIARAARRGARARRPTRLTRPTSEPY
jgi:hypothetical protein